MQYKGITWHSDRELSKKLRKNHKYVCYHLKHGKTYEEIIDMAITYKSYKGINWTSDNQLSLALGMSRGYVSKQLKLGKSYKQIIDHVLNKKKGKSL